MICYVFYVIFWAFISLSSGSKPFQDWDVFFNRNVAYSDQPCSNSIAELSGTEEGVSLYRCLKSCHERQACDFINYHMILQFCMFIRHVDKAVAVTIEENTGYAYSRKSDWNVVAVDTRCQQCNVTDRCVEEASGTSCKPAGCGTPISSNFAVIEGNNFNIGAKSKITCIYDRDLVTYASCGEDGLWIHTGVTCPHAFPTTTTTVTTTSTSTSTASTTTTPTTTTTITPTPSTTRTTTTTPTTTSTTTTSPTTTSTTTTSPTTTPTTTTIPTTTPTTTTTSTTTTAPTKTPTTTTTLTTTTAPTTTRTTTTLPTTTRTTTTTPTTTTTSTPTTSTITTSTSTTSTTTKTTPTTTPVPPPFSCHGVDDNFRTITLTDGTITTYSVRYNDEKTFSDAKYECNQLNANLLKVTTSAKRVFVEALHDCSAFGGEDLWIDGKKGPNSNVVTTWDGDTIPMTDEFFAYRLDANDGEDCVRLKRKEDYKIGDKECDEKYAYICERQ